MVEDWAGGFQHRHMQHNNNNVLRTATASSLCSMRARWPSLRRWLLMGRLLCDTAFFSTLTQRRAYNCNSAVHEAAVDERESPYSLVRGSHYDTHGTPSFLPTPCLCPPKLFPHILWPIQSEAHCTQPSSGRRLAAQRLSRPDTRAVRTASGGTARPFRDERCSVPDDLIRASDLCARCLLASPAAIDALAASPTTSLRL